MPRTRKPSLNPKTFPNVPSPEEIQSRAAKVREDWTPRQFLKRSLGGAPLEVVEIRSHGRRRGFSEDW